MRYILTVITLLFGIALSGQNVKSYLKTADDYIQNGYYEDAIKQYSQAISLEPQEGELYELRARAKEQIEKHLEAADDYKQAALLDMNPAENYYRAAYLHYQLNYFDVSIALLKQAVEHESKYEEAYLLLSQAYIEMRNYEAALEAASNALDVKNSAFANYLYGLAQYHLGEYTLADESLEKAVIKDELLLEAYLTQAQVQLKTKKYRYAIENCSYVLLKERNHIDALVIRSQAHNQIQMYGRAIADISQAIALDSIPAKYYQLRGDYYQHNKQYSHAIKDYTHVLNTDMLNRKALEARARTYESMGLLSQSASDLSLLLSIIEDDDPAFVATEQKIYTLRRESDKPRIHLSNPLMNDKQEVLVARDLHSVEIAAHIEDASKLRFLRINNDTLVDLVKGIGRKEFSHFLPTAGLEYLTVSATDVYNNTSTVSYVVEHIETKAPLLSLMDPYVGDDGIIHLNTDDHYLYLEGRVEDESLIRSIRIEDINASYAPGDYNPRFTANIDVRKKNRLRIQATDTYGNKFEAEYFIQRQQQSALANNPMGKTWVVLIENSDYKEFTNLSAPAKDVQMMQQALGRYDINKVIIKRNLTKREMERFFALDLRDLVRANEVNSLFIWFAGHGKNLNGTGYWIPSDARMDQEFSYFNINALKASLYSYPSLSHILVVSDACETGPAFCQALRGPIENVSCQQTDMANKRSAQVLTSAGSGYAYDNSLFTQSFVNSLLNNDDDCVSIDDIAKRVQLTVGGNSAQKPEFGRITGIKDDLGTFFFMTR